MDSIAIVETRDQLKQAVEGKVQTIVITDHSIARNIRIVKLASQAALAAAVAGAAIAALNFWNPVGWTVGIVDAAAGGTLLAALLALGLGGILVYAIYSGYSISAKSTVKLPDGPEISGELVLTKK